MHTLSKPGQSLVEFALGFGVLILILSIGAYFGMGMYYGQMAGDAIREVSMHKFTMADDPGAYSPADLAGLISNSKIKGNIKSGSFVDSGTLKIVKDDSQPTALVVGQKKYVAMGIPLIFTVSQGVQKNLLEKNEGSTKSRTWFPPMRTPPWQNPVVTKDGQPLPQARCAASQSSSITEGHAQAIGGDDGTYLPSTEISLTSPMDLTTTFMLAQQEKAGCASAGGTCQAEYQALLPKEKSKEFTNNYTIVMEYYNPPGAPGQTVKIYEKVDPETGKPEEYPEDFIIPREVYLTPSDNLLGAEQGFYIDPTDLYKKPPADFPENCKKRKQGQCALKKAVERAAQIKAAYAEECNM